MISAAIAGQISKEAVMDGVKMRCLGATTAQEREGEAGNQAGVSAI